jgi:dTDP-glucose 4,6-dehydratase
MRILITGGLGFIGQNLINLMLDKQNLLKKITKIINVDAVTYSADETANVCFSKDSRYKFYKCNICDSQIEKIIYDEKPNAIIHLAAESHVDRSIQNPLHFVETNVLGTCNLLNAAMRFYQSQIKEETCLNEEKREFVFYHVSTDEVFGSLSVTDCPFTEETPYKPRSPYSASKASSDHFVEAFHETYGLPILMSNCSNNYGPSQFPEKLIPKAILSALLDKPIEIYGVGSNVRDWLYVQDHAQAILDILFKAKIGSRYNIGGNCEISNLELIERLCLILDSLIPKNESYKQLITFVEDRAGHDFRYAINAEKIRQDLGWFPVYDKNSLDKGLLKTVKWYLDNKDWLMLRSS